jgi:hypothetical protein
MAGRAAGWTTRLRADIQDAIIAGQADGSVRADVDPEPRRARDRLRGHRGQFPTEQAALKVLYLAVRNLEEFRSPNTGIRSSGWKQALQAFTIYFDGRIPTP